MSKTNASSGTPSERKRSGSLLLLLIAAAGGIYVGMRWHTTFERLLAPYGGGAPAEARGVGPEREGRLWTCGMHPQVIQDHPGECPICHMKLTPLTGGGGAAAEGGGSEDHSAAVMIDPAVVQNMGIRTAIVEEGAVDRRLRFSAIIAEPSFGHRDVNLRVSGWIEHLFADTDGMEVKEGQPLFDLYSPELTLAIEELISAKRSAGGGGASGEGLGTGGALVGAAEGRLEALGLTGAQIKELGGGERAPTVVTFVSPMDGHVTAKEDVYTGSAVTAGMRVMRIAQRTTMWVEARVPEHELGLVRMGAKGKARVDTYPGREFDGEVVFVHPHIDEGTRTALVRMQVQNEDHALHEGMYATVEIDGGDDRVVLLAPREAVIDGSGSQIVFVRTGEGRFEPRAVAVGASSQGGLVEIRSGLERGDEVVTSGQFLIDSESRLREAIAKFMGQKESPGGSRGAPGAGAKELQEREVDGTTVDGVVEAYLGLAELLGAVEMDEAPLKVEPLAEALGVLRGAVSSGRAIGLVEEASAAAAAMKGKSLAEQRELFKVLSAAMVALVDALPPSPTFGGSLFVVNCPMVKADWLQRSRVVANPYYAREMKACGSVVREVARPAAKGAR